MYEAMNIAPMCLAPLSLTDIVYNPSCYTDPFLEGLSDFLRFCAKANLILVNSLLGLIERFWLPTAYTLIFGVSAYWVLQYLFEENDEPLTSVESEIAQYIQMNASTGCTARMICEHLVQFNDGYPVRMDEVQGALQQLKKRGIILSTQATLWVVSGK
jgi:hypothetical protein